MNKFPILCPSGRCVEGAHLLGIVQQDGKVALLGQALKVDAAFLSAAAQGRPPEKRFRFAEPCVQSACKQWKEEGCSVIGRVHEALAAQATSELPECAIRPNCRWYVQRGESACRICPFVLTDMRPALVPE